MYLPTRFGNCQERDGRSTGIRHVRPHKLGTSVRERPGSPAPPGRRSSRDGACSARRLRVPLLSRWYPSLFSFAPDSRPPALHPLCSARFFKRLASNPTEAFWLGGQLPGLFCSGGLLLPKCREPCLRRHGPGGRPVDLGLHAEVTPSGCLGCFCPNQRGCPPCGLLLGAQRGLTFLSALCGVKAERPAGGSGVGRMRPSPNEGGPPAGQAQMHK